MSTNVISTEALIEKFQQALDEEWGYIWGTAGIEWTAAKQKQKVDYMINKYGTSWQKNSEAKDDTYYRAALIGDKWIGHKVADCSGLFKWALGCFHISIAHGSNTIYLDYCKSKGKLQNGKRLDGKTLQPGTAVFVYNKKKDNYSHIGLYIGGNKVIEAQGTDAGVCTSNITASKWTNWGELKAVKYVEENDTTPIGAGWRPTIRRGNKSDYVAEAQKMLLKLGYNLGSYGADGDFGKVTENAVKEFQRDHKLNPDGVVGPMTWDALQKATDGAGTPSEPLDKLYTVCIHHLDKTQADALKTNYPGCTVTEE